MFALYFTGLYADTLSNPALHAAVHLHFVVAGCLFFWPVVGIDPTPHRLPYGGRLALRPRRPTVPHHPRGGPDHPAADRARVDPRRSAGRGRASCGRRARRSASSPCSSWPTVDGARGARRPSASTASSTGSVQAAAPSDRTRPTSMRPAARSGADHPAAPRRPERLADPRWPAATSCSSPSTGSGPARSRSAGAYNRISQLPPGTEVVAASAGNHAQGVALAASLTGRRSTIFMPVGAALPKVDATRGYGATVRMAGDAVDDGIEAAQAVRDAGPAPSRAPLRRPRHHRRAGHAGPGAGRARHPTPRWSWCRSGAGGCSPGWPRPWPPPARGCGSSASRPPGPRR